MNRSPDSEQALFLEALEKPAGRIRSEYVRQHCGPDIELRQRIESLLAAHEETGDLLDHMDVETNGASNVTDLLGTSVGPYKIREQIGEGGFGVVYVAEQDQPIRRKVALKVIKPGMDSKEIIARFEAERQALAMMDHPNVARVLDAGTTETGRPFFVMELVRGVAITEFCDKERLTTTERLKLFINVCLAVEHAHQKGIIHRDIKPNNVLITLHDGRPVAKVIDFGVAKALHQKLTEKTVYTSIGQMIGTPMYMSPEQAEMSGLDVDTRSDVYSLGVLLYELLTGSTPFDLQTLKEAGLDGMRRIIQETQPIKPSARVSTLESEHGDTISDRRRVDARRLEQTLRGDLDWVVMKALEKDRERRYSSPADLVDDIERYLADEAVDAGPPSAFYRANKFIRRHRLVLASSALVLLTMIIGAVFSVLYALDAHEARVRAEHSEELANERLKQLQIGQNKLTEEQQKSERRFDLAKDAVAKLIDGMASRRIVAYPDLAELHDGLLETTDEFYSKLLIESPNDADLLIARANVRERLKRSASALEDLLAALKDNPDNAKVHYKLADFYCNTLQTELRNPQLALEHAKRSVELQPDDSDAWHVLAWVYYQHFPRERVAAARAFLRSSKHSESLAMKALNRAIALHIRGQHAQAIEAYSDAIELKPGNIAHAYLMRANCYADANQDGLAAADYTRSIEFDAFTYETYRRRAHAWMALEEYKLAAVDWEKSHSLAPHLRPKYRGLLTCYLKAGLWSRAASLIGGCAGDHIYDRELLTDSLNRKIDASNDRALMQARDDFLQRLSAHVEQLSSGDEM